MWSDNLIPGTQLIKMNQAKKKKKMKMAKKVATQGEIKYFVLHNMKT